jgi:NAD(P)H dehydrogenase (quinone)
MGRRNILAWTPTRTEAEIMTQSADVQIVVVVYSRFGVLEQLAQHIVEGVHDLSGAKAHVIQVAEQPIDELLPGESEGERNQRREVLMERLRVADALIVGAPAYYGSMASPVKRFFEDVLTASTAPPVDRTRPWRRDLLRDKVGAAFTASATPHGGNELALHSILTMFMHLGMLVVTPGQAEPLLLNPAAPYGATAVAGATGDHPPTAEEEAAARELGLRVARIASVIRAGRAATRA